MISAIGDYGALGLMTLIGAWLGGWIGIRMIGEPARQKLWAEGIRLSHVTLAVLVSSLLLGTALWFAGDVNPGLAYWMAFLLGMAVIAQWAWIRSRRTDG
jgi:hypothetical protein